MLRFIIRRALSAIPVMIIGSLVVFLGIRAIRDPSHATVSRFLSPEATLKFKHDFGLDKPWYGQYWTALSKFLRFDMGSSLTSQGPVWPTLRSALANSVVLGLFASFFAITIGVIVGIVSAVKQYSWFDHTSTGVAFFGLSMPPFLFAYILIFLVGVFYERHTGATTPFLQTQGIYDAGYTGGFDLVQRLQHLILPAMVLAVQTIAVYSRYMRTSMLENLNADYLRTARAKGISERRVIVRHALRNALIPLTTFAAIDLGALAGGLIVTERIFNYPGMGDYFLTALDNADYPQLLPWSMFVVVFVVVFNVLADISYAFLDPRIRID